jgi:hypothetical protein
MVVLDDVVRTREKKMRKKVKKKSMRGYEKKSNMRLFVTVYEETYLSYK